MSARELSSVLDEMRIHISRMIRAGFRPPDEVARECAAMLAGEAPAAVLDSNAEQITKEVVAAHQQDQATWPQVTDCDRLEAAFRDLNESGIVSRQNFSCCSNCGVVEIGDEIRQEMQRGIRVRGYVFYHMQDTENAAQGCGLLLNYGVSFGSKASALEVGRAIEAELQKHGLTTEWSGETGKRIGVNLDWKRRYRTNS